MCYKFTFTSKSCQWLGIENFKVNDGSENSVSSIKFWNYKLLVICLTQSPLVIDGTRQDEVWIISFRNLLSNINFTRILFFLPKIIKLSKLDISIRNSYSLKVFKKRTFSFVRPSGNSLYNTNNMERIILLTALRVGLSYLKEDKFKHSSSDTFNPIRPCGFVNETLSHFFLHYPLVICERQIVLHKIENMNKSISIECVWPFSGVGT